MEAARVVRNYCVLVLALMTTMTAYGTTAAPDDTAASSQRPAGTPSRPVETPVAAIEKGIRHAIALAEKQDVMGLLEADGDYKATVSRIQEANPKSMWPDLVKTATTERLSQLKDGYLRTTAIGDLLSLLSFEHKITDIESRVSQDRGNGGETFVTIDYPNPANAPIKGGDAVYRSIILRVYSELSSGEIERLNWIKESYYEVAEVPFRITGVVWAYNAGDRFGLRVTAAKLPLAVSMDCGDGGKATPRVDRLNGISFTAWVDMPGVQRAGSSNRCSLTVTDAAGHNDSVALEHVSRPILEGQCWVLPVYRPIYRLAVESRCGGESGNLVDDLLRSQ